MGRVRTLNLTCIPSLDFLTLDSHYSYSSSIASWMNGRGGGGVAFSFMRVLYSIYTVLFYNIKQKILHCVNQAVESNCEFLPVW